MLSKKKNLNSQTVLDINLRNLRSNYSKIKRTVKKNTEVAATVKADGYGLGSIQVVESLIKEKCRVFFVATLDEAIILRKQYKSIQIQVLNGLSYDRIKEYDKFKIIPIINTLTQLKRVEEYSKRHKRLEITIHFDTGMSRLGLDKSETSSFLINKNRLLKYSNLTMIMSHLACGDEPKNKKNLAQLKLFKKISENFLNIKKSISNSAGILLGRNYDFDLVRPGISLYGGNCQNKEPRNLYKNVASLRSKIIQKRFIYKGDTVGYGATFKAKKEMLIGTIPIGYADGFTRYFSNKTHFYLSGKQVSIIGRISMDLTTVDLTSFRNIKLSDDIYIEILNDKNNINDFSKVISTIPYELLTSLGKRYQRRYIA